MRHRVVIENYTQEDAEAVKQAENEWENDNFIDLRKGLMDPQTKPEQFEAVIEKNKGIIYKISNSYCADEESRKDLFQEIVYQLWRSFNKYDDRYKLSTWMYKVALNVAISFYRKDNRRKEYSLPLTDDFINFKEDKDQNETENNILLLQQFISQLKELDRALMILYLEEKSYLEIAEILGISETNVATKISRIKDKLKEKFLIINNL